MVTVPDNTPSSRPKLDSLTHVDISTLSQSELLALSLCSSSAFDLHCTDDVVVPKIDRFLFNESAGSRRQTYSRLRPPAASRKPHQSTTSGHRRRLAGLLPVPKPSPVPAAHDPERSENKTIVYFLKHLIENKLPNNQTAAPFASHNADASEPLRMERRVELGLSEMPIAVNSGERKRKRGRKPKVKVQGEGGGDDDDDGRVLEIVNRDGVAVDLTALANVDDPYGDELRRRTVGLETEEECLGFMRDLAGQWGSRRKKRKIVDASDFGDALPVGWKLLLGLKRREGRVSLYCRRYLSPSGQQFLSCKEAASYLQSYFGHNDANQTMDHRSDTIQQAYQVASGTHAGMTYKDDNVRKDIISYSTLPSTSIYEKEVALLGIDNLAEVQVRDLFECHKCNMTFDEKDTYLKHLLSSHQRTTRRYRLGSSVGDGVIVKDGKYECQFCHKIFHERRRYNGHVGIHVRNYVRRSEELPGRVTVHKSIESPSRDGFQSRISKMDALIEIAQSSILEAATVRHNDKSNHDLTPNILNVVSTPEIPAANSDHEPKFDSPPSEVEMEDRVNDRTLDQELNQQDSEYMISDVDMEKIDNASNVVDVKMNPCFDTVTAFSVDGKNGNTFDTFDGKDALELTTDDFDKSEIEQGRDSESHLLALLDSQKICGIENNMNMVCTSISEHPKLDEVEKRENSELEIVFGRSNAGPDNEVVENSIRQTSEENVLQCEISDNDVVENSIRQTSEENVLQCEISDTSMPLVQSLQHCFPIFNAVSDKGEDEFCSVDQKLDSVTGFEELKLDEIEPLKFSFVNGQESPLPEVPMDMANDADMEGGFNSSVRFESEEDMLNMAGRHQLAALCVWCRTEFNHEAVASEMQSDSVGFMCPACKAKISGQLNVFNSGLSMNSHHL